MVVQSLEIWSMAFSRRFQVGEVVGRQDLSLQYGEEYLNLVEPTGVYRSVDLYGVGIPLGKAFDRGFASMRGTVIRNPEDSPCRAIGLLSHDQVHQPVVGFYSRCLLADSEELGPVDIPSGKIGQGALSFVFKLHTPWLMRQRAACR